MVLIIRLICTVATAFVLSVVINLLQLEGIVVFISYILCVIYASDKVSMHYIGKYISKKQTERIMKNIDKVIEINLNELDDEDEDE